jgi:hypothetical protein
VVLAAIVAAACSAPALAAEAWWQRIDGYAVVATAIADADPYTGGRITASFDDADTVGVDKTIFIDGGRKSSHYLPSGTLGARFYQTPDFTYGLELHGYTFSDGLATTARDAPGTTPLTNFATYREENLFKMDGSDITATASYRRWGVTAEGQVGIANGTYRTRSEFYTFGVFTTGNFINLNLSNGTLFKGDGLVYGLRLAYVVPRMPFSVVGRYKHSKLDGKTTAFGSAAGSVASSPSAPLVGAATVTRADGKATGKLHDMEFGLQYDFSATVRTSSFVRVTYTRKELKIRGLRTGGAGFGGTINDLTINSSAIAGMSPPGLTVGKASGKLQGFQFAVGFEF